MLPQEKKHSEITVRKEETYMGLMLSNEWLIMKLEKVILIMISTDSQGCPEDRVA